MFRSTQASLEIVDYHLKEWDEYLAHMSANENNAQRPLEPQMALRAYHNKHGPCVKRGLCLTQTKDSYFTCKTHTNKTVKAAITYGVEYDNKCHPERCKALDVFVDHGRNGLSSHCPAIKYSQEFFGA